MPNILAHNKLIYSELKKVSEKKNDRFKRKKNEVNLFLIQIHVMYSF